MKCFRSCITFIRPPLYLLTNSYLWKWYSKIDTKSTSIPIKNCQRIVKANNGYINKAKGGNKPWWRDQNQDVGKTNVYNLFLHAQKLPTVSADIQSFSSALKLTFTCWLPMVLVIGDSAVWLSIMRIVYMNSFVFFYGLVFLFEILLSVKI